LHKSSSFVDKHPKHGWHKLRENKTVIKTTNVLDDRNSKVFVRKEFGLHEVIYSCIYAVRTSLVVGSKSEAVENMQILIFFCKSIIPKLKYGSFNLDPRS
jgi:hypothetical protein